MRSEQEQIAGLTIVAEKLKALTCNCMIEGTRAKTPEGKLFSDVAILYAPVPNASQIVYAEGEGYDVWADGGRKMVRTAISVEEAVQVVAAEYKANKIDIVMTRMIGKNWKRKKSHSRVAKTLAYVTAEVMNDQHEKLRSEMAQQRKSAN